MVNNEALLILQNVRKSVMEKIIILTIFFIFFVIADHSIGCAGSSKQSMKGPCTDSHLNPAISELPISCMKIAFTESITFYQKWISPVGGDRCGFRPSCSRYGHMAVTIQGPVVGLMMTGDRLIRCNIWKEPGPDYFLLPNGRLFDPITKNILVDP